MQLPEGFLRGGQAEDGAEAVREENAALKDALEVARMELADAYKKVRCGSRALNRPHELYLSHENQP